MSKVVCFDKDIKPSWSNKKELNQNSITALWSGCFFWRQSNNLINKLQERALRIMNHDQESSFQDLISKRKEYTTHQK